MEKETIQLDFEKMGGLVPAVRSRRCYSKSTYGRVYE